MKCPKIIQDVVKYDDVFNLLISDPRVVLWVDSNPRDTLWCVVYPIIKDYVYSASVSGVVIDNMDMKLNNWFWAGGPVELARVFMDRFLVDMCSCNDGGFPGQ